MNENNSKPFFKNKDDAAGYLYHHLKNPTPIKLQKGLYFLWAFYAATYGSIDTENSENKGSIEYPTELFKPNFEAWQYGPVDSEIWKKNKDGEIQNFSNDAELGSLVNVTDKTVIGEVKLFMDDLIKQIDEVNDFGLVERSHQDECYREAFKDGTKHCPMDPNKIKRDYRKYVEQEAKI